MAMLKVRFSDLEGFILDYVKKTYGDRPWRIIAVTRTGVRLSDESASPEAHPKGGGGSASRKDR